MSLIDDVNSRRLIGGDQNIIKLNPVKYKWAMDYYHAANANHWLPQEINMQKDIEQWNTPGVLTDNEKQVVKTALGFFTTADSLVANNLVLLVYSGITAPECRMYLLRQAYEEAIHTHSYQHIVETLGLDETEIFDAYKNISAIYNKDNFVTELANGLYNGGFDSRSFVEALIDFYVIMEGIFFYTSFAAIMSFKRRNLLPGTVEQFQYIMRDESMHLNFGIDLIKGILAENPEIQDTRFAGTSYAKIIHATKLEQEYARALIGNGILGMNVELYTQYAEYITDRRLVSIGLGPKFNTQNPFPWMSEVIDLQKEKNFFETRVTEYQTGGALEW